ncbi:UDP-N-acetylglucosamine diphosphorylase/glucosamine-1-phosphate N-acetyltransferase [cyanobiont of Ornithocercus magnificus]|nr:UDP-N-acetylglucosamine diphosphorylase/glucosamine-1-phosphate N-acetyltransferase [cyanobiont of Ornithocercus magnificus]
MHLASISREQHYQYRFWQAYAPHYMLVVAVLAAGRGSRMKSTIPKALHLLAGVTMVERVLANVHIVQPERRLLIIGYGAEQIKKHLNHLKELEFVLQLSQRGTGHAVQALLPVLQDFNGELLVLNSDAPLLQPKTISQLVGEHRSSKADMTILTARLANPSGYGRVFTNSMGQVSAVVEHLDCSEEQKHNNLINAGAYCFSWPALARVLPKLRTDNHQNELYLTDTVAMLPKVRHLSAADTDEIIGVNNCSQLADCEFVLQQRLKKHWMMKGVTFIDPASCTLSEDCSFGYDVVIEPQTHLRGICKINNNCRLGPGSLIEDTILGQNTVVLNSVVRGAIIGNSVTIGPFAHLRPNTKINDECRVGNFVEVKNSRFGKGTKASHLSYIGDADLGHQVNIGAGTITANYDGTQKHQTIIGDGSRTGANSVIVAPVILGTDVMIGAGSTITRDIPNGALGLGRARQLVKQNWKGSHYMP